MPAVASAATSVVIAHVAGGTSTIRVGAGGIMLPNHSPLVIAEQFGTLESLFPGRIDLGLGRAPGSDQVTAVALRRHLNVDSFPQDVQELIALFREPAPGQRVRAVPGAGLHVPIWILGSSLFGAQLAAELGLPFAFASHFAPAQMMSAIEIYRSQFSPADCPGRARAPAPDARRQRRRGRHRRGSAAALYLAPADVSRAPPRHSSVRCRRQSIRIASRRRSRRSNEWSCSTCWDRRSSAQPDTVGRGLSDFLTQDRTPTSSSSPRKSSIMRRDSSRTRSSRRR